MSFQLKIRTDHALLGQTAAERGAALARILREVAHEAETGRVRGEVRDASGGPIGAWSYKHGLFEDVIGDIMSDALRRHG